MTSDQLRFRRAVPADAEAITEAYFRSWVASLAHLFAEGAVASSDPWARLESFRDWLRPDSGMTTVVVTLDDRPMGHATIRDDEVVHLFLDPSLQGRGVGPLLLDVAELLLAERGHRRIRLFTLEENERAIRSYTRLGWTLTDEAKAGTYFGEPKVEVMLTKDLTVTSS